MAREEEGFFDDLARGLADGSITRGRALRLMGAALVGGALGSLGIRGASADPKGCTPNGKDCKRDKQCCSGNCSSHGRCVGGGLGCLPNGDSCGSNGACCSGNCSNGFCCASGRVGLSNGTCAVPCRSPADCPDCGPPHAVCFAVDRNRAFCGRRVVGTCGPNGSCPTGQFCAFGNCVVGCP